MNVRLRFLIVGLILSIFFLGGNFFGNTLSTNILRKKDESITLVATGDIMLDRFVRDLMNRHGLDYPFQKLDGAFFKEADILLGNLEGPVVPKKTNFGHVVFGMLPDTIPILKEAGFDVFALANNHALDQGWKGHDATKQYLTEAGIGWFGHPAGELHEENVHYIHVKGKTFAFVGLNDVFEKAGREKEAIENIKKVIPIVKKKADYVIVSPHWGVEYKKTPVARQVNLAHAFIDAGADLIVGHHPHVVQTAEKYKGKWIYYSLGNFIFDQYWSKETQKGLVIRATFRDGKYAIEEFPIASVKSQPFFVR